MDRGLSPSRGAKAVCREWHRRVGATEVEARQWRAVFGGMIATLMRHCLSQNEPRFTRARAIDLGATERMGLC